jgi:hypothetical protein
MEATPRKPGREVTKEWEGIDRKSTRQYTLTKPLDSLFRQVNEPVILGLDVVAIDSRHDNRGSHSM